MKLLLIEDDPGIIDVVEVTLELRWPDVKMISTFSGKKGVELARTELPDLILLDLGLPDITGFEVLKQIRVFSDVPVMILTVRGEELDKIKGIEMGADDYMVKPFSPGELLARLNALLRRGRMAEAASKGGAKPFLKGKIRIDFSSKEVSIGDKLLKIGPSEYDLLYMLVTNEGKVLTNQQLLEEVFPEQKDNLLLLRAGISRLRDKLEESPDRPEIILNEGEIGYKFVG